MHEGTLAAEDFFELVLQQRAPVSVETRYYDLSKALVEAVQMCAYGSDRVLAASLILGPSGRTVERLVSTERSEFDKLVRERAF